MQKASKLLAFVPSSQGSLSSRYNPVETLVTRNFFRLIISSSSILDTRHGPVNWKQKDEKSKILLLYLQFHSADWQLQIFARPCKIQWSFPHHFRIPLV
jgi:hypothetical protein